MQFPKGIIIANPFFCQGVKNRMVQSAGNPYIFLPCSGLQILPGHAVFLKMEEETWKKGRKEVCAYGVRRGDGLEENKRWRPGGQSRTVTFTRYDMATVTRCPPHCSAKLLSQSAPVSRSQPSAAPALLGHGLVPQSCPGVGRRCHCPTVKRGFQIQNTHSQTQ